jgi:hypothetical protein
VRSHPKWLPSGTNVGEGIFLYVDVISAAPASRLFKIRDLLDGLEVLVGNQWLIDDTNPNNLVWAARDFVLLRLQPEAL